MRSFLGLERDISSLPPKQPDIYFDRVLPGPSSSADVPGLHPEGRNPERLRFGICWQRDAQESALTFGSDPRFRVLDVPWRESRGTGQRQESL